MAALREFWFPIMLTLVGMAFGGIAMATSENGRRVMWSFTALCWFLAILTWIWGDPVRGPFAKLVHPHSKDDFSIHSGAIMHFPIRELAEGIDFAKLISFTQGTNPVRLKIRKTWWTGTQYSLALEGEGQLYTVLEDNKVGTLPVGCDVNWDDNALEVINAGGSVIIQVIQDGDQDIYVNTVMYSQDGNTALVLN